MDSDWLELDPLLKATLLNTTERVQHSRCGGCASSAARTLLLLSPGASHSQVQ